MMKRHFFTLAAVCFGLSISMANAALVNQYTFNDGTANDSVSAADGTLLGTASVSGGDLVLTGGGAGDSYVALPSGVASAASVGGASGEISTEAWVDINANSNWAVIFSFGNSGPGAMDNDGSDGDYWQLIPQSGPGVLRLTTHIGSNAETFADDASALATGSMQHVVSVLNTTADTNELYVNGVLVGSSSLQGGFDPSVYGATGDTQNWLGRSQWGDPSLNGSFAEFRIYDHALTAGEVTASLAAGPVAIPEPTTLMLFAAAGCASMFVRRRS